MTHSRLMEGGEFARKSIDVFPVVTNSSTPYIGDDTPTLKEGTIMHFKIKKGLLDRPEGADKFVLLKDIAGLHYIFSLAETYDAGVYHINFKTDEYEYAWIRLNAKDREVVFATLSAFIQSVSEYTKDAISRIDAMPAGQSYTAEEIDNCVEAVLKAPHNIRTREELLSDHKGFRIFDLYEELYGKNFHAVHYNLKNRARGRSVLFKAALKKYLSAQWNIVDRGFGDFSLERKLQ